MSAPGRLTIAHFLDEERKRKAEEAILRQVADELADVLARYKRRRRPSFGERFARFLVG